jgi:nitroreductase
MNLKTLIFKTRSCRRFNESHHIDSQILESLIDLARLSASGANRQPLKYLVYNTPEDCDKIFPLLSWAGYLNEWPGPDQGERPSGYIVILGDKSITEIFGVDHGIAAQSIMLGATEAGLGGCIIDIKEDNVKYWRDSDKNHHVPKRSLKEIIIKL